MSELKVGEKAKVISVSDDKLGIRLMELGIVPGEEIEVNYYAPLGDPISITVSNYQLSIRKSDANSVIVE